MIPRRLVTRLLGFRKHSHIAQRNRSVYAIAISKPASQLNKVQRVLPIQHARFTTSRIFCDEQAEASVLMEIKFDELRDGLSNKSLVLVDVREPKELVEDGKIPGSINVPLGDVDSALALTDDQFQAKYGSHLPSKDDSGKLAVSCRSGKRASVALVKFQKAGYESVRCYAGSFLDWQANDGPVEKP